MSGVAILLYALEVLPPKLSSHTYPNIKGVQYSRQMSKAYSQGVVEITPERTFREEHRSCVDGRATTRNLHGITERAHARSVIP